MKSIIALAAVLGAIASANAEPFSLDGAAISVEGRVTGVGPSLNGSGCIVFQMNWSSYWAIEPGQPNYGLVVSFLQSSAIINSYVGLTADAVSTACPGLWNVNNIFFIPIPNSSGYP